MDGIDGPTLLILILVALGYYTVDTVKKPIQKAGHTICHVVTFGKKCSDAKPQP